MNLRMGLPLVGMLVFGNAVMAIAAPEEPRSLPQHSTLTDTQTTQPYRTLAEMPGGIAPLVAQTSGSTEAPTFMPWAGVRYTGDSAGSPGFTSIEGFIPIRQTPGDNLTFVMPRLNIFNDSNLGSNLTIGHRFLTKSDQLVLGGSLSYDNRDVGSFFANQVSVGLEALAKRWDIRANGYVPVGDTRQLTSESLRGINRFQGTNLLLNRFSTFDAAMAGFDLEAGAVLLPSKRGYLRPFLGTYYYTATGSENTWGIRGGASYLGRFFSASLAAQHDDLFGTKVLFNVGLNFPGRNLKGFDEPTNAVARLGDPVVRQNSIVVDNQRIFDTILARNPATGQPWQFHSVVFGNTPAVLANATTYANIQAALAAAAPGGQNGIVYVYTQSGIAQPILQPFTIPDGVSVVSSAPAQLPLNVLFQNTSIPVRLPANTGVYPRVTVPLGQTIAGGNGRGQGLIVMGNNTTLSGFEAFLPIGYLASIGGLPDQNLPGIHGIRAVNVSNFSITDSRVINAFAEGIYIENASGTARILRNTVINTQGNTMDDPGFGDFNAGIFVYQNRGDLDLIIDSNRVQADASVVGSPYAADGIEVNLCRDLPGQPFVPCTSPATANVQITNNTVLMTGAFSDTSGADGIDTNAGSFGRANFVITGNTVQAADNGITFDAERNDLGQNSAQVTFRIERNAITTNFTGGQRRDGIDLDFQGSSIGDVVIANNTLNVSQRGIDIESSDVARVRLLLDSNSITTAGSNALRMRFANSSGSTSQVDVTLTNNSGNGSATVLSNNSGNTCVELQNNSFENTLTLTQSGGATLRVNDAGNNTPPPTLVGSPTPISSNCVAPSVP